MSWHNIPIHPGLQCELSIRFDGSNWIDVTDDLRSFSTTISRSRSLGVFPPGNATFVLNNRHGSYTPLNSSSTYYGDLYPGRHIRYREKYSATEYDVWYGIIEDWGDSYPQARDGIATVSAYQPSALLARYSTGETTGVGADEMAGDRISRILTAASWTLGSTLDDGMVPLQALTWGTDAMSAISGAVRTEMGALWCERDGSLVFEDRYALISNSRSSSSQATFGPSNVPYFGEPPLSSGLDLVVNQYTAGNTGQTATTMTNSASVTDLLGTYADSDTSLIGSSVDWAAGNADGMVRLYGYPVQHPLSITLRLGMSPSTVIPQALGRRIRDKVTVNVPTPWGSTLTCPVWIVGVTQQGSPQEGRSCGLEFEPAGNYSGIGLFTLDSSSLDGSDILGW